MKMEDKPVKGSTTTQCVLGRVQHPTAQLVCKDRLDLNAAWVVGLALLARTEFVKIAQATLYVKGNSGGESTTVQT